MDTRLRIIDQHYRAAIKAARDTLAALGPYKPRKEQVARPLFGVVYVLLVVALIVLLIDDARPLDIMSPFLRRYGIGAVAGLILVTGFAWRWRTVAPNELDLRAIRAEALLDQFGLGYVRKGWPGRRRGVLFWKHDFQGFDPDDPFNFARDPTPAAGMPLLLGISHDEVTAIRERLDEIAPDELAVAESRRTRWRGVRESALWVALGALNLTLVGASSFDPLSGYAMAWLVLTAASGFALVRDLWALVRLRTGKSIADLLRAAEYSTLTGKLDGLGLVYGPSPQPGIVPGTVRWRTLDVPVRPEDFDPAADTPLEQAAVRV
jgi:hypothetical protein